MPSITRKATNGRTRRDAVRGELLAAVERLLVAGESYTALGIQRICDEAGVARSAFYTNFANKSELLVAVVASAVENIFTVTREWAESDPSSGKAALEATMANSLRVWREHYPLLAAYQEVSGYDRAVGEFWRERFRQVIASVRGRIERDQRAGLITPALDPDATASFIVYAGERMAGEHVAASAAAFGRAPSSASDGDTAGGGGDDGAVARNVAEIIWTLLYGR